jgi:alkylhydroperoxidase family enzyme
LARVSFPDQKNISSEFNELFARVTKSGGRVLNLFKVMAHCPQIGRRFLQLGNAILFKGVLPPHLRELAILRVGLINKAKYEWTQHVPVALRAGVRQAQIDTLPNWKKSTEFDGIEKMVLAYTDEETLNIRVSDDTFKSIRKHISEEAVVELTTTIAYYGMVCRVLETLQIELEKD